MKCVPHGVINLNRIYNMVAMYVLDGPAICCTPENTVNHAHHHTHHQQQQLHDALAALNGSSSEITTGVCV